MKCLGVPRAPHAPALRFALRTQRFAHSTLRALNASRTQRFTHPEPHPSTSRDTCTTHCSSLDTSKGGEDERGWYGWGGKQGGRQGGRDGGREGGMGGPAPLPLITKTLNRIRDKKQHLIDFEDFDPPTPHPARCPACKQRSKHLEWFEGRCLRGKARIDLACLMHAECNLRGRVYGVRFRV